MSNANTNTNTNANTDTLNYQISEMETELGYRWNLVQALSVGVVPTRPRAREALAAYSELAEEIRQLRQGITAGKDEVTVVPPFRYPGEGSGVVLTQEQIDRRNRA
tara:strand:- start:144 stop:461 length:318 start_codon:yes stop_codon:yes gene_type:complete